MLKPLFASNAEAHTVLLHLLTVPDLGRKLLTLHRLALYESGGALLGPEEKEALRDVEELQLRLDAIPDEVREEWRSWL